MIPQESLAEEGDAESRRYSPGLTGKNPMNLYNSQSDIESLESTTFRILQILGAPLPRGIKTQSY